MVMANCNIQKENDGDGTSEIITIYYAFIWIKS